MFSDGIVEAAPAQTTEEGPFGDDTLVDWVLVRGESIVPSLVSPFHNHRIIT